MVSTLAPILGRFILIPVALSGVCLSMLFSVPMASAMEGEHVSAGAAVSVGHTMVIVENQDHETQPECCVSVRMEHDTRATASDSVKTLVGSFAADLLHETFPWRIVYWESARAPLGYQSSHQPFSLIGTTIKRE